MRDIKVDNDRRTVLQLASAVVGSLVVARSSAEFQWAQKLFRPLYIEAGAEQSQRTIFPTAMLSGDVDKLVAGTLATRGFTAKNTLLAHSVCSDEVNGKDEQLVNLMVKRWGEGFALGGLGGLPFAGKSGFRAYLHHVPDSGKLLVMFAPHVGVDGEGRIGALQRDGQSAVSKACGAAIGAFKAAGAQKAALKVEAQNVLSIDDRARTPPPTTHTRRRDRVQCLLVTGECSSTLSTHASRPSAMHSISNALARRPRRVPRGPPAQMQHALRAEPCVWRAGRRRVRPAAPADSVAAQAEARGHRGQRE